MLFARTSSLLLLALVGASVWTAGCAAADDAESGAAGSAIESSSERLFRFRDAQNEGTWLFRIQEAGGSIAGHMVLAATATNGQGLAPGSIDGAVGRDGTYWMTWKFPDVGKGPARPTTFEGKLESNGDLKGTMTSEGEAPKPLRLSSLRRGTLDRNAPLMAQTREDTMVDACKVQVTGVELFALPKVEVEHAVNAKLRAARDGAAALCSSDVESVSGGPFVGVLRKDVFTWSSGLSVVAGDRERREEGARVNVSLEDGSDLALFGDVLEPGRETALADEIQKVIDALPANHFVGRPPGEVAPASDPAESMRADLKAAMRTAAERHELGALFLLVETGISFATKGFEHPRVSSVVVPYEKLRSSMASRGRARSVWETAAP